MFEKEAAEYQIRKHHQRLYGHKPVVMKELNTTYKDGFNDGYNKANEWHYPSKGEYPKDNSFVLVWTIGGGIITTNYGEEYSDGIPENGLFQGIHISDVIAWKEIVPPKVK